RGGGPRRADLRVGWRARAARRTSRHARPRARCPRTGLPPAHSETAAGAADTIRNGAEGHVPTRAVPGRNPTATPRTVSRTRCIAAAQCDRILPSNPRRVDLSARRRDVADIRGRRAGRRGPAAPSPRAVAAARLDGLVLRSGGVPAPARRTAIEPRGLGRPARHAMVTPFESLGEP